MKYLLHPFSFAYSYEMKNKDLKWHGPYRGQRGDRETRTKLIDIRAPYTQIFSGH